MRLTIQLACSFAIDSVTVTAHDLSAGVLLQLRHRLTSHDPAAGQPAFARQASRKAEDSTLRVSIVLQQTEIRFACTLPRSRSVEILLSFYTSTR